MKKYAVIIPVYNRPKEVEELLESLTKQTLMNFSVYIIEDGSSETCESVVESYQRLLPIHYFKKKNSGPGQSRNYGVENSHEEYVVFFDSDCIIPKDYFRIVDDFLLKNPLDAYGGPDAAHEKFSNFQKAINYSMTSFFTTGGIRGGGEKVDKFFPRSFNMGYARKVHDKTKGFSKMRFGEDIDMSIRIMVAGFKTGLIKDAYVYHNRRSSFRQFYKQVFNSGIARINLFKRYPESLKLVHSAPSVYVLGTIWLLILGLLVSGVFLLPLLLHWSLIFMDASIKNKSIVIGFLSVLSSIVQLWGYGLGFLLAAWKRIILGKDEFAAFADNFYE